jgi:hypothetical protein
MSGWRSKNEIVVRLGGSSKTALHLATPQATRRTKHYDQKEDDIAINDIGPKPQSINLEDETVANANYRTVVWSGRYLQLTLMSIPEGGDIGFETHPETDQFLRLDAGRGRA